MPNLTKEQRQHILVLLEISLALIADTTNPGKPILIRDSFV